MDVDEVVAEQSLHGGDVACHLREDGNTAPLAPSASR
jgi:hypothetical protein